MRGTYNHRMATATPVGRVMREVASLALEKLREERAHAAKIVKLERERDDAVGEVAHLTRENARIRREREGWLEIAQDSQRRVTELEEQLAKARGATRTT